MRRLKQEKLKRLHRKYPDLYAECVLDVNWWFKQQEIADALIKYGRVFVKAGNGPGKTFLAGGLVNWFFDMWQRGICLTTAPTGQQVKDVLWKEVRSQRKGRAGLQPKAPRMETAPDHYAVGYTAESADAFQGRHEEPLFLIFDEATGIHQQFWEAGEGMQPRFWLAMLNPTDTSSYAYTIESRPGWHIISLDSFEHPNIVAELAGESAPYPKSSLRLGWLRERVEEWCYPIQQEEVRSADIEFEGEWYRPGPLFEARVLGRWPSGTGYSVWSEAMWQAALKPQQLIENDPLQIGCDVARFGDDFTTFVVRRGNCALHHETHNGWNTVQTTGRCKELARQFAQPHEDPKKIAVCIDDDGVGGGVVDQRGDYNFVAVNAASSAFQKNDYPNKRSEMWFTSANRADEGRLDLSRLSEKSRNLIRQQVMAPVWKLDSEGRRVVEKKEETKKRIGRSPDDADGLNLAYSGSGGYKFEIL